MSDNRESAPLLKKFDIIALTLFSAMMFFLILKVFTIAQEFPPNEPLKLEQIEAKQSKNNTTYSNKPNSSEAVDLANKTKLEKKTDDIAPKVIMSQTDVKPVLEATVESDIDHQKINRYCENVGKKLGSVNVQDCKNANLQLSGTYSNQNKPLTFRDFKTEMQNDKTRIMVVGGIHGDEFSGVSISFKWLNKLAKAYANTNTADVNNYHWRMIPILNPDGLLQPDGQSRRMNANAVDLNRNFPTEDWDEFALKYWINKRGRDPRRYPGPSAGSEIETQWIVQQINDFNPHAVISIHAPYGIVDSDGPIDPPKHIGPLQLKILGTYPGSMGRYVGVQKNIPMLTVELKRAGTMPSETDIDLIWEDIQKWIAEKVLEKGSVAAMQSIRHEDQDLVIDKKAGD